MVENTRSQEMKHMDDAIRRNAENTEKHAEALEGIKNSIEGLTLLITTLNAKYESLSEKVTSSSSSPTYQQPPLLINPQLNDMGFQPKLDFPKFFGEDPESWIYKCEIFGGNAYEDTVGQLTKLKQWSSVKMYQEKFEELASKTTGLSEEFLISCFVCGLKEEIMAGVKMLQPRTIAQAMGLARLQEETINAVTKKNKPLPKVIPKSVPINIPQTNFQENGDFIQCAIIEEIASLKQSDMRESSLELKEIHNSFESLIKEMDSEEVEMENGNAKVELQSESGHATNAESSYLVDSEECLEKVLILKNHSFSNSHHSPFLRHRSDRTLDSRNTWVQRRKFKNDQLCVCQRKPHVICHVRTWDDGTIKIWHPGDSAIFIRYAWICKAALTGIWDPGGVFLENLTASWGEKARKCGEATSTSAVRSFDKESEPLVEMGNTKGNDGLKPWRNSKRQIQDSCLSKAVKYSRFEAADMGSRTKNDATRIKVYRLNDDGKWDDQGTGHVTVDYLERSEELGLFVVDEEDHETLLMHHISSIDIYWNQEDTIISWRDPEYSTELALSFQEPAGCSYIWDQISSVQRHLNFNSLSNDSYHSVSSELRELPAVELSTLPLILKTVVESGIANQMRITELILHDQDFFRKRMEVFRVCEDLEHVDGLHVIFKIVGGIILLNSPQIFEKIFGDELIMDIIGPLEYDPDIPHVQHHRSFLKKHVVFKEALPIKDPVVLSKIHRTYRGGYLKDVILPRALDDATIANLNSIIHSNTAIVVSLLKDDGTFIQELFARLRSSTTYMESTKNLDNFLLNEVIHKVLSWTRRRENILWLLLFYFCGFLFLAVMNT